jgi:hypothetical protein
MLFALTHLCVIFFTTTTHPTCVFLPLVNDTHIVGLASNVVIVFLTIVGGVFIIGACCRANKVCNLVSTRVGPFYITSSWLFIFDFNFRILGGLVGSRSFI